MKRCDDCRTPDGELMHVASQACNWLDGMAKDDRCPHCGGPVYWFEPAPLGALLDRASREDDRG